MMLEMLSQRFCVCLVKNFSLPKASGIWFLSCTDREISLVCEPQHAPQDALAREDGWRGLRVGGSLDFALVGILSRLTGALAKARIPVFAVSTYQTDYLLVREETWAGALDALRAAGYALTEAKTEDPA